ncbi:MAG TPA: bifunctional nuclease family protein [Lentimicrobium sp.]|nr:bifunctional nuclease family protein [Lentimicrobium sp.]
MEKIALNLLGMINSQSQSGAYTLILGEAEGKRRLPILINGFEAQAILFHIEKIKIPRPLTHDLFKNFADTFNIRIKEVIISKFAQGIFYGTLICEDEKGIKEIDSRTSDAIALAVRFGCPIFTYEKVLTDAGVSIDEEPDIDDLATGNLDDDREEFDFDKFSNNELEEMMNEAIEKEEYERASLIRDILNRRKSGL